MSDDGSHGEGEWEVYNGQDPSADAVDERQDPGLELHPKACGFVVRVLSTPFIVPKMAKRLLLSWAIASLPGVVHSKPAKIPLSSLGSRALSVTSIHEAPVAMSEISLLNTRSILGCFFIPSKFLAAL